LHFLKLIQDRIIPIFRTEYALLDYLSLFSQLLPSFAPQHIAASSRGRIMKIAIVAASVSLVFSGAGRLSIDRAITGER
jgi:hypothetical protein